MSNVRFINRGKTGEIWLYDQVGEGWFGGMSAKQFISELNGLGKVDVINLHINSPGGSVFEGNAIYNTLVNHPARVEVDIDGLAASIASVIAMAGDEIRMADNAMLMVHQPYTVAQGDSAELRKTAELLDQLGVSLVNTYAKRTGIPAAQIAAMMAAETWMSASEAVQNGFADRATEEQRIAACAGNSFNFFDRTPTRFKASAQSAGHSIGTVKIATMGNRLRGG